MLTDCLNEERLEHSQAESAGVLARVCTPSSPVRERKRKIEKIESERERLNFYAWKGAHTLFTGQRER